MSVQIHSNEYYLTRALSMMSEYLEEDPFEEFGPGMIEDNMPDSRYDDISTMIMNLKISNNCVYSITTDKLPYSQITNGEELFDYLFNEDNIATITKILRINNNFNRYYTIYQVKLLIILCLFNQTVDQDGNDYFFQILRSIWFSLDVSVYSNLNEHIYVIGRFNYYSQSSLSYMAPNTTKIYSLMVDNDIDSRMYEFSFDLFKDSAYNKYNTTFVDISDINQGVMVAFKNKNPDNDYMLKIYNSLNDVLRYSSKVPSHHIAFLPIFSALEVNNIETYLDGIVDGVEGITLLPPIILKNATNFCNLIYSYFRDNYESVKRLKNLVIGVYLHGDEDNFYLSSNHKDQKLMCLPKVYDSKMFPDGAEIDNLLIIDESCVHSFSNSGSLLFSSSDKPMSSEIINPSVNNLGITYYHSPDLERRNSLFTNNGRVYSNKIVYHIKAHESVNKLRFMFSNKVDIIYSTNYENSGHIDDNVHIASELKFKPVKTGTLKWKATTVPGSLFLNNKNIFECNKTDVIVPPDFALFDLYNFNINKTLALIDDTIYHFNENANKFEILTDKICRKIVTYDFNTFYRHNQHNEKCFSIIKFKQDNVIVNGKFSVSNKILKELRRNYINGMNSGYCQQFDTTVANLSQHAEAVLKHSFCMFNNSMPFTNNDNKYYIFQNGLVTSLKMIF